MQNSEENVNYVFTVDQIFTVLVNSFWKQENISFRLSEKIKIFSRKLQMKILTSFKLEIYNCTTYEAEHL